MEEEKVTNLFLNEKLNSISLCNHNKFFLSILQIAFFCLLIFLTQFVRNF